MEDLANMAEGLWMRYNAAVVNRLHPDQEKINLANFLINNATDIIKALRAYTPPETADIPTGDITDPPKKVRKSGER